MGVDTCEFNKYIPAKAVWGTRPRKFWIPGGKERQRPPDSGWHWGGQGDMVTSDFRIEKRADDSSD